MRLLFSFTLRASSGDAAGNLHVTTASPSASSQAHEPPSLKEAKIDPGEKHAHSWGFPVANPLFVARQAAAAFLQLVELQKMY